MIRFQRTYIKHMLLYIISCSSYWYTQSEPNPSEHIIINKERGTNHPCKQIAKSSRAGRKPPTNCSTYLRDDNEAGVPSLQTIVREEVVWQYSSRPDNIQPKQTCVLISHVRRHHRRPSPQTVAQTSPCHNQMIRRRAADQTCNNRCAIGRANWLRNIFSEHTTR